MVLPIADESFAEATVATFDLNVLRGRVVEILARVSEKPPDLDPVGEWMFRKALSG